MDIFTGLDLGGSSLKYGYGSDASSLSGFQIKTHRNSGRKEIYSLLVSAVNEIRQSLKPEEILRAVSLGSPGYIDSQSGEVLGNSPNLNNWSGSNPREFLQNIFDIPIFIENDADLMAFGEAELLNNSSKKSLLGITIGTGIGSGFVSNDSIYHGALNAGMDLGHLIIVTDGERCDCGKAGCLEKYASVPAIEQQAEQYLGSRYGIDHLLSVYDDNEEIRLIIDRAYDKLGIAIANAVTLLDPGFVVIGGGLTECSRFSLKPIEDSVKKYLNDYQRDALQIREAHYKNRAGVIGGIRLARKMIKD